MLGCVSRSQRRRDPEINPQATPQSRARPLCSQEPTTHLRVAAHCSLFRASLSFFRELPLLTRPHLAQPLPASAVSAAKQPLFVAARRHRRCLAAVQRHARREQKVVCGLRQVRSLRMLIRARTTSISACQTMLFRCALPTSPRLTAHSAAFAEHTTDLSPIPSRL